MQLKLESANIQSTISKAEAIWKKYFPQLPFEYKFLDQDFNSQYAADQKRGKIFAAFSILTIIITCLGLLGSDGIYYATATEGNKHPPGIGSLHGRGSENDHQELFMAGINCCCYCIPGCVVFHE